MLQNFIDQEPTISTLDALVVSGADVGTYCDGLYTARQKQDNTDLRIYDLWAPNWAPPRSLIFYLNENKKMACMLRLLDVRLEVFKA